MQRYSLGEIRERTYKPVDAWWTVLLVDPVASRLVRLVAPIRWITPNRLTTLALLLALAAAACFSRQSHGWLILGAALFHLGFVVDCMDGKVARLNGSGSLFGAWSDFMVDRLRAILCAIALMGGQYLRTGDQVYLWLATAVVGLDLLRYLNSAQMGKVRAVMRMQREQVYGLPSELSVPGTIPRSGAVRQDPPTTHREWLASLFRSPRIRSHLFSGIEFEMAVFIVGPLTGWVSSVTIVASVLLVIFELRLIRLLWRATRRHTQWQAALQILPHQPRSALAAPSFARSLPAAPAPAPAPAAAAEPASAGAVPASAGANGLTGGSSAAATGGAAVGSLSAGAGGLVVGSASGLAIEAADGWPEIG